ncbi:hypothetical protein [Anaerotardibacter muris]|uniref:hypothetical protein n=1 Tax=Anaerotardibacter muris TaxID=2941505 RepID=UPI002041B5E4|nr:hypothetical protein [Anaerotardibacter muris]
MNTETNHRFECWNCHTSIAAKHARSTCPQCGASLVLEDFDVVASECAERYRRAVAQSRVLKDRLDKLERPQKRFSLFGALLFLTAHPWIKKLHKELRGCERELHAAKSELYELSKGRWFTDPRYAASGQAPGRGCEVRRARYNPSGCFIVTPGESDWRNARTLQEDEDTQPFPCTQHHAA